MQRKFLEDLGLEKEIVDKIMAENGSDIEKTKSRLETERDGYKEQLETAQNALKEFDGIDVKDLQGKIKQLETDIAAKETEYQNKLADMEFNSVLDSALSAGKARNAKAVKALLDLDTLKASKNQAEDIRKAIETLKSENDWLFDSEKPTEPFHPVGSGDVDGAGKEKMSLSDAMKYKNEHPEANIKDLI